MIFDPYVMPDLLISYIISTSVDQLVVLCIQGGFGDSSFLFTVLLKLYGSPFLGIT